MADRHHHTQVAPEAWPMIGAALGLALLTSLAVGLAWAAPLWVLTGSLVFLYRDPPRSVPSAPLAVVSPVDAWVTAVEQAHDDLLSRGALRISLRMVPWGVLSLRSPTEGKVIDERCIRAGAGARCLVWVQSDEGDDLVVQIAGDAWRRLWCYVQSGERVGQGQRCGFLRLAAEVQVFLPASSRPEVSTGERVTAGSSVLATLIRGF
jgi:phosphatidylserine decarboxylase